MSIIPDDIAGLGAALITGSLPKRDDWSMPPMPASRPSHRRWQFIRLLVRLLGLGELQRVKVYRTKTGVTSVYGWPE